jgi:hypothetical protein
MELVGAFSDTVDTRLENNRGRTDLGEMAQAAAVEAMTCVFGERFNGMFETGTEEVRRAVAEATGVPRFGTLTRAFFSRLVYKILDYFLSRALSDLVGEGRRFTTLAQESDFCAALEIHCQESAYVLYRYAGKWARKERWEAGVISQDAVPRYVGGAVAKLIQALKQGGEGGGKQ